MEPRTNPNREATTMTPSTTNLPSLRDKPGIIYLARNTVNGKCYVGQTQYTLTHRRSGHLSRAKFGSALALHSAIRKYGVEKFHFEVLQNCCGRECLDESEKWWIKEYDCISPNGYNLTYGGGVPEVSDETRKKLSEIQKKRATPERMRAMSLAASAKGYSPERKEKLREFMKGRYVGEDNPCFGRKMTDWQKKRVSETHNGKKKSEESNRKRSEALKGRKNPKLQGHAAWNKGMKKENSREQVREERRMLRASGALSPQTSWNKGKKCPGIGGSKRGKENPFYGKHHSEETKKRYSEMFKGKKLSEERKQMIRDGREEAHRRRILESGGTGTQSVLDFGHG